MKHVVVIGAGITGVTTAYALLKAGLKVTVIDKNRYAAMETSFANGGQLSASNAEVWTNLGTIIKGLKWMLRRDAPLLVNPSPSWHKYSWFTKFLLSVPSYEQNTIKTAEMAIEARQHMFDIAKDENIDFDLVKRGILHVYYDAPSLRAAESVNELLRRGGLERRRVDPAEISALEPALKGNFAGGYYTESDFTGDIHKFTRGLADACSKAGGKFLFGRQVEKIEHGPRIIISSSVEGEKELEDIVADGVVICAGVGSRRLATMVGDSVDVYPVKGYSITVNLDSPEAEEGAPWVSLLDEQAKIVTSRLGSKRLRVAGTAEFNGENLDIRHDRTKPLIDWTIKRFPRVPTNSVVPWAGLRPMMPNMMPQVRSGKSENVFYNTGHGHLGWTLSCLTAELVSQLIRTSLTK